MGQAPVTGPRKLQEIRGLRGGWWQKEAQSTQQLWLKSLLLNVRYHEQAGIEGRRGGLRAKGEVQITSGLGTLFAFCGVVVWKEDFNLIRRLTHLLRASHGPGAGYRRRKRLGIGPEEELNLSLVLRKGATSPTGPRFTTKLRGSPQDSQSIGLSRCHNNKIEIQGPVIAMKNTEMRHSRMWLALQFREPEGPPPSSFQAATV